MHTLHRVFAVRFLFISALWSIETTGQTRVQGKVSVRSAHLQEVFSCHGKDECIHSCLEVSASSWCRHTHRGYRGSGICVLRQTSTPHKHGSDTNAQKHTLTQANASIHMHMMHQIYDIYIYTYIILY